MVCMSSGIGCHSLPHASFAALRLVGADWAGFCRVIVHIDVGQLVETSCFVQIRGRGDEWWSDHVFIDAWLHVNHLFAPVCHALHSLPCLSYKHASFPSLTQQVQLGPASGTAGV